MGEGIKASKSIDQEGVVCFLLYIYRDVSLSAVLHVS